METNLKLMPGRCKPAEYGRNFWFVTVEAGTTREDLKRPEYWSLVSKSFRVGDRIEVQSDDGGFFAEYLVRSSDVSWAIVYELRFLMLDEESASLGQEAENALRNRYTVQFRGPHLLHCIEFRESDDKVKRVKEGIRLRSEAEKELQNVLHSLGAAA